MESSKPTTPVKDATQETATIIIQGKKSLGKLTSLLGTVNGLPTKPPSLFLDGEGFRDDTVAFLNLLIAPENVIYRISLHAQHGGVDLATTNDAGVSLKSILESKSIPKVAFDIRQLSHVLFRQHGVKLAGIQDLQLMELASRDESQSKKYVAGLGKCVEQDVPPSNEARMRWLVETGSIDEHHVFNVLGHAPRSSMRRVEVFPTLWTIYRSRLRRPGKGFWRAQARWETEARVDFSQVPKLQVSRKEQVLGPKAWYDHKLREKEFEDWTRGRLEETLVQFDEAA